MGLRCDGPTATRSLPRRSGTMLTYALLCGGGRVGMLAWFLVLRYRRAFSIAMLVAYAGAALGLVYGAKLQFRMDQLPPLQAFAVLPSQLLTPGYHIPLGLVGGLVFGAVAC